MHAVQSYSYYTHITYMQFTNDILSAYFLILAALIDSLQLVDSQVD